MPENLFIIVLIGFRQMQQATHRLFAERMVEPQPEQKERPPVERMSTEAIIVGTNIRLLV